MEQIFELLSELMTDYDAEPVAFRVVWENDENDD